MELIVNRFGSAEITSIDDLPPPIYIHCCACMSILAEGLSWANAHRDRITTNIHEAQSVLVLGCQVTDLAVLNDLCCLESLHARHPDATFAVGGCLARRFDIPLGDGVKRVFDARADYQVLEDLSLVYWERPFWATGNSHQAIGAGSLFRNYYPLRISVGCRGRCAYCTIKDTRGDAYDLDPDRCRQEFCATARRVVLIADSPSSQLVYQWCRIAYECNTRIALRNIEPVVALSVWDELMTLASRDLLSDLHVPVQSANTTLLAWMKRDVHATERILDGIFDIRELGVRTATNIIVDIPGFSDAANLKIFSRFDYVSWNPYWNGSWDRSLAEQRFTYYSDLF